MNTGKTELLKIGRLEGLHVEGVQIENGEELCYFGSVL